MLATVKSNRKVSARVKSHSAAASSVRSLGVAPFVGTFCLPKFHDAVPLDLLSGSSLSSKTLAKFALTSGIKLPEGSFTTVIDATQKQWEGYFKGLQESALCPNLYFLVNATSDYVDVSIHPTGDINAFYLKPLVERLNGIENGLGWWVYDFFYRVGCYYCMYNMNRLQDIISYDARMDATTDAEQLENYNSWYDTEFEAIEEFRKEYEDYFPSDLVKCVDGHGWMLNFREGEFQVKPPVFNLDENYSDVEGLLNDADKAFLLKALKLKEMTKICSDQIFGEVPDFDDECSQDILGATCFMFWNESSEFHQIIDDYERHLQEGGEYRDSLMTFRINPNDDDATQKGIVAIKSFFDMHCQMGELFAYLEKGF